MTRLVHALGCILALLLTGCATTVGKQYPPSALLEDCRTGPLAFSTNTEVTMSIEALASALRKCNIDKSSLREWAKE